MVALDEIIQAAESFRQDLRALRKDADLKQSYKNVIRILTQYWRMQSQDFMKAFDDIFTEAVASVTRIDRAWNTAASRANARLVREMKRELAENIRSGAASSLTDVKGAQYGVGYAKNDPRIIRYINQRAADLAKELTKTSQERLRSLITRLGEEGKTKQQIGKAVRAEIRTWHNAPTGVMSRAELVSITETGEAYEFGRDIVVEDLEKVGVRLEKRWIYVADRNTCDLCKQAVSDGWLPIKAYFSNGFKRPLAHPACRCDVQLDQAV